MKNRILSVVGVMFVACLSANTPGVRDATCEIDAFEQQTTPVPGDALQPHVIESMNTMLEQLTVLLEQQDNDALNPEIATLMTALVNTVIEALEPILIASAQPHKRLSSWLAQYRGHNNNNNHHNNHNHHSSCQQCQPTYAQMTQEDDLSGELVLAHFTNIAGHFASIVASPHDRQRVGNSLVGMLAGLLHIIKEARRTPLRVSPTALALYCEQHPEFVDRLHDDLVAKALVLDAVNL